jgi:hypothetical protein
MLVLPTVAWDRIQVGQDTLKAGNLAVAGGVDGRHPTQLATICAEMVSAISFSISSNTTVTRNSRSASEWPASASTFTV